MNNEELLHRQAERHNQVIDALLKENVCLRAIITTYLLPGKELSETEKELIRLIAGNAGSQSFLGVPTDGNSESNFRLGNMTGGNNGVDTLLTTFLHGNNESNSSLVQTTGGKGGSKSARANGTPGISKSRLAGVITNISPMMKTAPKKAIQNTAVLLLQWQANPATTTAALCKLTGMSQDGMAKRIMAMKKAKLIVRRSAPLRYELTEKAKGLLA